MDQEKFIQEQAVKMVQHQLNHNLKEKLVEMFSAPRPVMTQKIGDDLFILDNIFNWEEKSAKLIYDIVLGKIKDYERIHDEYKYMKSEYDYDKFGGMRLIFHFTKIKEDANY